MAGEAAAVPCSPGSRFARRFMVLFKELGEVDGASSPLVILSVGLQWLDDYPENSEALWDFSDSKSVVMWVEQLISHPPVITTNRWYKPFPVMDGL